MQKYSHVFDSIKTLIDTLAQIFLNRRGLTIQVMGGSWEGTRTRPDYLVNRNE